MKPQSRRHERLGPDIRRRLRPFMSGPEKATLRTHREALIPQATGSVLEIGGGTGANLPFYEAIATITLTEPDKPMMRRLERRLQERSPGVLLLRAPAEDLPFEDDSFDVAISTLVLCTVDDQPRALRELPGCSSPAGACCSSSTYAPTTIALPDGRTG